MPGATVHGATSVNRASYASVSTAATIPDSFSGWFAQYPVRPINDRGAKAR
jgi:hypothetical protein